MLRIARGSGHRAEWTKAPPAPRISVRALTWRSGHPVVSKPFPFGCLPSWVNRGLPWQGSAPLGAQELAFRVRGPLADPLPSEGGSPRRASLGNADRLFAGIFRAAGQAMACPPARLAVS